MVFHKTDIVNIIHSFIQVIGKIVAGSGFEDIVFQSDLSSSGSLNGVLCGSHYNRSWITHNTVSEALERMLFLQSIGKQHCGFPDDLCRSSTETQCHEFACKYKAFRQSVKEGKLSKAPQFWMIYLDLMRNQNMIHLAIQENDFDSRLYAWQEMLPLYFATSQVNYARYGSIMLKC